MHSRKRDLRVLVSHLPVIKWRPMRRARDVSEGLCKQSGGPQVNNWQLMMSADHMATWIPRRRCLQLYSLSAVELFWDYNSRFPLPKWPPHSLYLNPTENLWDEKEWGILTLFVHLAAFVNFKILSYLHGTWKFSGPCCILSMKNQGSLAIQKECI